MSVNRGRPLPGKGGREPEGRAQSGSAAHGGVGPSQQGCAGKAGQELDWAAGRLAPRPSHALGQGGSGAWGLCLGAQCGGLGCGPYVEVLHRLGDVELVHSGDDDGRGGEEEEQDEEDDVDDQAAEPPDEAADGEVLPGRAEASPRGWTPDPTPATPRTSVSSRAPLGPLLAPWNHPSAIPLCSPVDVLGVGGVGHGPVGDV